MDPQMDLSHALDEAVKEAGFTLLKTKQEEVLKVFISGKDTFVALPTGYGKSIIFTILSSVINKLKGMF